MCIARAYPMIFDEKQPFRTLVSRALFFFYTFTWGGFYLMYTFEYLFFRVIFCYTPMLTFSVCNIVCATPIRYTISLVGSAVVQCITCTFRCQFLHRTDEMFETSGCIFFFFAMRRGTAKMRRMVYGTSNGETRRLTWNNIESLYSKISYKN